MPINLLRTRSSHPMTSTRPLDSSKAMTVVRKVYDVVESILWAGLLVFVGYFFIYILPHLPEIRSRAEAIRMSKISSENSFYCEKWGMKPGTHEHALCTMDLQKLRQKIEQEIVDDQSIL